MERAVQICLEDFQDTAVPPIVNIYLLVDFDSSESAIQLASLYPSSTCGYFSFLKTYFLILDM